MVAGDALNMPLGSLQFVFNLLRRVQVQPRLMMERMIADFVARACNGSNRLFILLQCRVLANDEESDALILALCQEPQDARYNHVKVRGKLPPTRVAMRFQVRPFVVQIQRERSERFGHVYAIFRICAGRSWRSASRLVAATCANCTLSFTFNVPFTICEEFTMYSPGIEDSIGGTKSE